jgi:hypothetical protein
MPHGIGQSIVIIMTLRQVLVQYDPAQEVSSITGILTNIKAQIELYVEDSPVNNYRDSWFPFCQQVIPIQPASQTTSLLYDSALFPILGKRNGSSPTSTLNVQSLCRRQIQSETTTVESLNISREMSSTEISLGYTSNSVTTIHSVGGSIQSTVEQYNQTSFAGLLTTAGVISSSIMSSSSPSKLESTPQSTTQSKTSSLISSISASWTDLSSQYPTSSSIPGSFCLNVDCDLVVVDFHQVIIDSFSSLEYV